MELGTLKQPFKLKNYTFRFRPSLCRNFHFYPLLITHNCRKKSNLSNCFSSSNSYIKRVERDEPLTPLDRLFLQPELNQIIHCVIGVKNPIDVDAVKSGISTNISLLHPRFSSLVVKDWRGQEHWRRTQVNVDQHVVVRYSTMADDRKISDEEAVNDYLAELSVSCPLGIDKPLWELHLLMAHNCVVLRVHHAIGDGISLMSMFLSFCRRVDDPNKSPTINGVGGGGGDQWRRWSLWNSLFSPESLLRSLALNDKRTVVSGGDGVELWPRKLATAKFKLDDMKLVKKAIPNATINDVLLGIISYGLYKYLHERSPKVLQGEIQITGVGMVNIRSQPGLQDFSKLMETKPGNSEWGNKFSMMLLPIYHHKGGTNDPLDFLKRAKEMMDKKKLSLEAQFTYDIFNQLLPNFVELASLLTYRMLSNTTFTISNIIGPREEITISNNPVTYMRVTSTSLPHAITMHMVSYAGKADMQILVAKDIIPDVYVLARCFEDALFEMKQIANTTKT